MKFYLASRFRNRPVLAELSQKLIDMGHSVVSRWLTSPIVPKTDDNYEAHAIEWAIADLEDVKNSDVLVLVSTGCESCPGGIWWEAGYAMALNKQVVVIGPKVNIFCSHPSVKHYNEIDDYLGCFMQYWVPEDVHCPGVYACASVSNGIDDLYCYVTNLNDTMHFKTKEECEAWIKANYGRDPAAVMPGWTPWIASIKHGFIESRMEK